MKGKSVYKKFLVFLESCALLCGSAFNLMFPTKKWKPTGCVMDDVGFLVKALKSLSEIWGLQIECLTLYDLSNIDMMKNLKYFLTVALAVTFSACQKEEVKENLTPTAYVNPQIGTGGHGHVFVGADVPFGLVQLGPTSIPQEWDWCSGYHESDSTVIGYSHMHLSGTGIGDLFDVTVMPVRGEVTYARGDGNNPQTGMWSLSDRSREVVKPGYYRGYLTRYDVQAELTATKRVGLHRYTFGQGGDAALVIDLQNGGCWDSPTEAQIRQIDDRTVCGYRFSKGWADDQRVFFYAEFEKPVKSLKIIADGQELEGTEAIARVIYARAEVDAAEPVMMKVALSPTSTEAARKNLEAELPGWDFEAVCRQADEAWNSELSRVKVQTQDEQLMTTFYTALYHTMIAPSEFCDVDGSYYGADHQMHPGEGFINYTTFSLWDTYRAAHPMFTLLQPERVPDMVNTMLRIYDQQGKLPVWHLMGCETNCMVGNPGIPVVADAVLKGLPGIDAERAYEAMKATAMIDERGGAERKQYGYIPWDSMKESVAYELEYELADWAVAQVALKLGKTEDYEYFLNRSKQYRQLFDPEVKFMRGKGSDGTFHEPFDPFSSSHINDDYCEGTAWQYTWLVPHDLEGLVSLFGSKDAFVQKLDSLFVVEGDMGEEASPDISGLIGQYAHGNEPSHHIIYFYTMLGRPWQTADRVRQVLKEQYRNDRDGLSGNEDVGQMSAWYVLSSLGFYQVEPAGGRYFFGSPIFDKAEIQVPGGTFSIITHNNSDANRYIQSITLNGQPYDRLYIDYADIMKGGVLELQMGNKAN